MRETQIPFLGWGDSLEKGVATHCSILDYRISWTEEPVGYSPKGLKESDMTEQLTHFFFHHKSSRFSKKFGS